MIILISTRIHKNGAHDGTGWTYGHPLASSRWQDSRIHHSMQSMRLGTILSALCVFAGSGMTQSVTIRGTVYDSLHSRPLRGALVAIGTQTAVTDSAGRFSIGGLRSDSYRATAQHEDIDRVGLAAVGAQVRITDGKDSIVLALPSFSSLWRLVCGPTPPQADTGFVFGTVRSTRGVRHTRVSASWIDIAANGTRISQKLRTLEVSSDSLGNYTLCGVPTGSGLSIRAVSDSSDSGEFQILPLEPERIARRDLTLGGSLAETIAAGRGASVHGRVLGDSGRAIVEADVRMIDMGQTVMTNQRGEYAFKDLPPGSHRLYVRKVGFAEAEILIDVEMSEKRVRDIVMTRITTLDSVAVIAKPMARDEARRLFEEHRRLGLGKFLSSEDLDKVAPSSKLSTLLIQWPGLKVPTGNPLVTWPQTTRGVKSLQGGCRVAVFLDGRRLDPNLDADLDHIAPVGALGAVEWYSGTATVPPEYAQLNAHCGVLVLHSKFALSKPPIR